MNITYLGNKELLGVPKTAFLAASNIPPDMVLKCYDWAVRMADEGRCVISGFRMLQIYWIPLFLVTIREGDQSYEYTAYNLDAINAAVCA